jgi:hypothetical protein
MRRILVFPALAAALLFTAACGDDAEKEKAGAACGTAPAAVATAPTLPAGFPTPAGVTYTAVETNGPTTIVHGYITSAVGPAFDAYTGAFAGTGLDVTKSEHESVDAEVAFAGATDTGQVKMVQECKDRTTLTITIRPA